MAAERKGAVMARTNWLDDQVELAVQTIRAGLTEPGRAELSISGLEQMLLDLAEKIVVSGAAGVLSRVIFERWIASRQSKENVQAFKQEIVAVKSAAEPADLTAVRDVIQGELKSQGVPSEQAHHIADRIVANVLAATSRTT